MTAENPQQLPSSPSGMYFSSTSVSRIWRGRFSETVGCMMHHDAYDVYMCIYVCVYHMYIIIYIYMLGNSRLISIYGHFSICHILYIPQFINQQIFHWEAGMAFQGMASWYQWSLPAWLGSVGGSPRNLGQTQLGSVGVSACACDKVGMDVDLLYHIFHGWASMYQLLDQGHLTLILNK